MAAIFSSVSSDQRLPPSAGSTGSTGSTGSSSATATRRADRVAPEIDAARRGPSAIRRENGGPG